MLHPHLCGCRDSQRDGCGGGPTSSSSLSLVALYPAALLPLLQCAESSAAQGRRSRLRLGKRRPRPRRGGPATRSPSPPPRGSPASLPTLTPPQNDEVALLHAAYGARGKARGPVHRRSLGGKAVPRVAEPLLGNTPMRECQAEGVRRALGVPPKHLWATLRCRDSYATVIQSAWRGMCGRTRFSHISHRVTMARWPWAWRVRSLPWSRI